MTEKKPQSKQEFIRYILSTPLDEIIDNADMVFVGDDEKARAKSISMFSRLRGVWQKGAQVLSGDDNDALITAMKVYISQKSPQE
jgi:hypothetical protein